MPQCPRCQAPVADEVVFCPNCGENVRSPQQAFCPSCGVQNNAWNHVCVSCGRALSGYTASGHQVWLAVLLSFFFTGAGQIYNRQVTKGVVLLIVTFVALPIVTFLSCGTGAVLYAPLWIVGIIDAALVGQKIANGRQVAEWEWF
jgi:TM2 domain-containing membrane protein YozV